MVVVVVVVVTYCSAAVGPSVDEHVVPRVLAPRQPTIGEMLYDAGDYSVKTSSTEIEIRFDTSFLVQKNRDPVR